MPESFSSNVAAANNEQPTYNVRYETYIWNPGSDVTPAVGMGVFLIATVPNTGGDGSYTPAYVDAGTAAEAGFTIVGVVVGGSSLGTAPVVGGLTMVATDGICLGIFNDTTTFGYLALNDDTIDGGLLPSATATLGKTYGTILQAQTYVSTPLLVPVHVHIV